jgi:hypothetical protein
MAKQIPVVQDFQTRLRRASDNKSNISGLTNQYSRLGGIGSATGVSAPRYGVGSGSGNTQGGYNAGGYGQGQGAPGAGYQYQWPKGSKGFMGGMFGSRR